MSATPWAARRFFVLWVWPLAGPLRIAVSVVSTDHPTHSDLQPDRPDDRDQRYIAKGRPVPSSIDLRTTGDSMFPPVYDQGRVQSCTANAVAALCYYVKRRQGDPNPHNPSRTFIYYNERSDEAKLDRAIWGECGAPCEMRDCLKSVARTGYCREEDWPSSMSIYKKPDDLLYLAARTSRIAEYHKLGPDISEYRESLASGIPFVCGIRILRSFLTVGADGRVPLPPPEAMPRYGHAIAVIGYDDSIDCFIIRNSLGSGWGKNGYGFLPYTYLDNPSLCVEDSSWSVLSMTANDSQRNSAT